MEKNYNNIRHSFRVLVTNIVEKGVDVSLLVIAGDIFESKSYLNTDDIHQWKSMCQLLKSANIKTLVMCGNHDYNINSALVRDNVSLLTTESNIVCVNETEIKDGIVFGDQRLEFYIFSPIDKKIPKILNNDNIKIAILHEPIDYARYDNGECITNSRFTADDLTGYDYVLLGDIHLHQFLTDRIAYCGSFVQKTKGEGIEKGYILWDLDEGVGKFHPILLKEVYIKISACDDKCELPVVGDKQIIRHLSLFYKNCSAGYITNLKKELIDKYKYIHRIVNSDAVYSSHDNHNAVLDEQPNQLEQKEVTKSSDAQHQSIIRDILKEDPNLDKILAHHADLMRNRDGVTYTTYKLNYLYFENIFCYGPSNHINFNEFDNDLVMISGKNKEGKSSIIDILIRVLFNENDRGLKEDLINKSQSKGFIKLSFNIGADEYIIEQTHNRVSKNQQHRLYKNNINLTQDTIINTYKYLRTTVGLGDYKSFVNLTTALQNRMYLCDMPQKDFLSLLTKVMNIDVLSDIEQATKKEIAVWKAIIKRDAEKLKDIIDIKESELIEINTSKNNFIKTRDGIYTQIDLINKELIKLSKEFVNINIPENLDFLIAESKLELSKYKKYSGVEYTNIDNELYAIDQRIKDIPKEKLKKIMETTYDLKLLEKRQNVLTMIKSCRDVTYKPINALRNATTLQSIIDSFDPNITSKIKPLERCEIKQLQLVDNIDNLTIIKYEELLTNGLPNYSQIYRDKHELEKKINDYNSHFGALQFSKDCGSCVSNKHSITNVFNIDYEKSKLDDLKTILNSKTEIMDKYEKAKLFAYNKEQNKIFQNNQRIIANNMLITEKLNEYNAAKQEMKEHINKKNWDMLQKLELQENLFQEYDIQQLELNRIKLSNIKKYVDSSTNYESLIKLNDIKKSNGNKNIRIKELSIKDENFKQMLKKLNTDILKKSEDYRIKHGQYETHNSLSASHNEAIEKLEFYTSYLKIINCKTGLPSIILRETAQVLEHRCNEILQRITDFTVKIVYDVDLKIYTVENEMMISAQLGSGMQRFVLDLIFRIVLTEISCISCPAILFVDEGFGCLDRESFISVAGILQKLKGNFKGMFIISHINELRAYVDKTIDVVKKGQYSNVQSGEITLSQKCLQLLSENNVNNKRVVDFKASGKEKKLTKKQEEKLSAEDKIKKYAADHGGLEKVLLRVDSETDMVYCHGCDKSYKNKKGFGEKHVIAATVKSKHDKYILNASHS